MLTRLFRVWTTERPGKPPPPAEALPPSPENFKNVFARLASSVVVVTFHVGRHLHGFTATSLTPVSLSPPMALFCVSRKNESHRHLAIGTKVGISVLAADLISISARFAGKAELGGYTDIATFEVGRGAVPLLKGAVAGLEGTVRELVPAGDHTIYLCRLGSAVLGDHGDPLLYFLRDYYSLGKALSERRDEMPGQVPS